MSDAENILVTGCSAGGLSTFFHLDTIASWFSRAVVKGAAFSGFFLPIENLQGHLLFFWNLLFAPQAV